MTTRAEAMNVTRRSGRLHRLVLSALTALTLAGGILAPAAAHALTIAPGNNTLVAGLGGADGFGATQLTQATPGFNGSVDDGYWPVDLSAVFPNGINFFGTKYDAATQVFVGTNGYFTFGTGSSSYTPQGIQFSKIPIIAIFYGDAQLSPPGKTYLNLDTTASDPVVTLTYYLVPMYPASDLTKLNSYQIRLHKTASDAVKGDSMAIEFRYNRIDWTYGDQATAGWADGKSTGGAGADFGTTPTSVFGTVNGSGTAAIVNNANGNLAYSNLSPAQAGIYLWQPLIVTLDAASTPQTAQVNTAFAQPLKVTVTDTLGAPVNGATVTIAAPASGATAILSSTTATTDASGVAQVTATANGTAGSYVVSAFASGNGFSAAVTFNLTNAAVPPTGITVSGGTAAFTYPGSAVPVDPGVQVLAPSNLDNATVAIASGFVAGQDVLACTPSGGITCSYNATTGILTLTGSASAAAYQTVLRTVTYNNTAGASANTGARSVALSMGSGLNYSGTGHFYEFVPSAAITWSSAKTAAEARTYFGLKGYLATITSAGENTFISTKVQNDGWMGAQASGGSFPRTWSWATGPETGTAICNNTLAGTCTSISGAYSNWATGEPNSAGGIETVGQIYSAGATWNDLSTSATQLGYMVEYGGTTGDPVVVLSGTRALSVTVSAFQVSFATDGTPGASVSPSASQTITAGGSTSLVTATAPSTHSFSGWTGTGGFTSASNPVTVTNVTGTMAITAHFTPKAATTTALASSAPVAAAWGETVTFTATPSAGGGTVQFQIDGASYGSPVVVAGGTAVATTSSLSVGPHSVVAFYSGDATHLGSTSSALVQVVDMAGTTVAVLPNHSAPDYATSTVLTATVTATSGAGTIGGHVQFLAGGVDIPGCSAVLVTGASSFTASCTTMLAGGLHPITVNYLSDGHFAGSTSAPALVNVGQIDPTLAVASGTNPSAFGQGVTFTATVGAIAPGAVPTGKVTFRADGASIAGCVNLDLDVLGKRTCTTSALAVASHPISVVYAGDGNYNNLTRGALSQVVDKAGTGTSVASDSYTPTYPGTVALTATVTVSAPGAGAPGGTVRFQSNGSDLPGCTASVVTGPVTFTASCPSALLAGGGHAITAIYSGDGSFQGSTSPGATVTVAPGTPTVGLTSDHNPSVWGQQVTLTATVGKLGAGAIPTGAIDFLDSGVAVPGCTGVAMLLGSAQCPTSALEVGHHALSVQYAGDGNYLAEASGPLDQLVNRAVTSTALALVASSTYGEAVTLTATMSVAAPGAGTTGGTVTFTTGSGAPLADCPAVPVAAGTAACTTTRIPVGAPTTVTATYSGDTHFVGSLTTGDVTMAKGTSTVTSASASPNPSTFAQLVTFDAAVTGGGLVPTGEFVISDPVLGEVCRGTLSVGLGACSSAVLPVGNYVLDVAYTGDANYESSAGTVTLVVDQATSALALASSSNPSAYGDVVTFGATVTGPGGTPTGFVTFSDGGVALCGGPVALGLGGLATCTPPNRTAGTHAIVASYPGDPTYLGSSNGLTQQVNKVAPATTLVSDAPAGSVYGAPVTFTFTASLVGGGTVPTGPVTFYDGVSIIGSGTLDAAGVASLTRTDLEPGVHPVTARYGGSSDYLAVTSGAVSQAVAAASTTTTLTASPSPSAVGELVTFSVTVAAAAPSTYAPGVTVQLLDGVVLMGAVALTPCPAVSATSACATFTRSSLTVGTHSVTARLVGTARFTTSTSAPLLHQVEPPTSTTELTALLPLSTFGDTATFRINTTVIPPGTGLVTGEVSITDGGTQIGLVTLTGGTALFATSTLKAGAHDLVAHFLGTADYLASSSSVVTQLVAQAQPRVAFNVAPNPSVFGQEVTLSAQITTDVVLPGGLPGIPTGKIAFEDDTAQLQIVAVVDLAADGTAQYKGTLPAGPHHLRARYRGADDYATAVSSPVTLVVDKAPTQTTLAAAPAATVFGQQLTLTATLAVPLPGAGTPTGLVSFFDQGRPIGTGTLNAAGTTASLAITSLAVGSHAFTATYAGDQSFATSTSAPTSRSIEVATAQVALASDVNPSAFGQAVPLSVTVSAVAPGAGTPGGTVILREGTTTLATLTFTNGMAATTVASLGVGSHTLTANYAGDGSFGTATTTLVQVVAPAASATSLAAAPSPSTFGQAVLLTATLTAVAPGVGTPGGGTVTFRDGVTVLGTPQPVTSGRATLSTTALGAGVRNLTASYSGDTSFGGSTGAFSQPVGRSAITLALTTSPNPSMYGQPVTVTVAGAAVAPGSGFPTGSVTVVIDGMVLGSAGFGTDGVASLAPVSNLPAGPHQLVATYGGDGNILPGTTTASHQVELGSTSIEVSSSRNPSRRGRNVVFTASVTSPHVVPTGQVTFKADGAVLGRGEVSEGQATFTDRTLAKKATPYVITAEYAGSTEFAASTGTLTGGQVVENSPPVAGAGTALALGPAAASAATVRVDGAFDAGNLTIEAWVKPTWTAPGQVGATPTVVLLGGEDGPVLSIGISADRAKATFGVDAATREVPASLDDAAWHHLALMCADSQVRFYVDGLLADTIETSRTRAGLDLVIGQGLVGQVDEVRVWSRTRPIDELNADAMRPISGSTDGLVGYWRFDEAAGGEIFDSTAGAHDGTATVAGDGQAFAPSQVWRQREVKQERDLLPAADAGYDVDGDPLTLTISQAAQHGQASADPSALQVHYRAGTGYLGLDTFTFELDDGAARSSYQLELDVTRILTCQTTADCGGGDVCLQGACVAPTVVTATAAGCGCTTAAGAATGLWAFLALGLLRRRPRRPA